MNPAPDADLHSVGQANFDWIVKEVADLAIAKAKLAPNVLELRWSAFLGADPALWKAPKSAQKKPAAKKRPPVKRTAELTCDPLSRRPAQSSEGIATHNE